MNKPKISVIMSVYNGMPHLPEAIESILNQSFPDFELIIVNDCSSDNSLKVIKSFTDKRIKIIENVTNIGLTKSLNKALKTAKGGYIARMDADDISLPKRFQKQIAFFNDNPKYALLGTWAKIWKNNIPSGRFHKHPQDSQILRFILLFNNPFVHSSVMFRKSAIDQIGLYNPDFKYAQDYELWSRFCLKYAISNIPEVLHIYREIPSSVSRAGFSKFEKNVLNNSCNNIKLIINEPINDKLVRNLSCFINNRFDLLSKPLMIEDLYSLFLKLTNKINKQDDNLMQHAQKMFDLSLKNYKYHNSFSAKTLRLLSKLSITKI